MSPKALPKDSAVPLAGSVAAFADALAPLLFLQLLRTNSFVLLSQLM